MSKKALSILNGIILAVLIGWNYYSNTGVVNNETIGSLSDKYSSLFVPADYAFGIWGLIYLGLAASAVYFIFLAFRKNEHSESVSQGLPPLIVANLANGVWLWFWLNEQLLPALISMVVVLVALIFAVLRLNMQKWDAPVRFMALVWWPIDIYLGWISVALIANVAAYLNWLNFSLLFSDRVWTVLMIAVACLLNLFMIFNRNMREFAAVGIWAFVAIAVRHWMEIPLIGISAVIAAIALAIASGYHANRRIETLPHKKIKRGEI